MSLRLIIRSEAEADIVEAALWYENQREGLGLDFTAAVRNAIHRALDRPFAHRVVRRRLEVRRALVDRFPYRVFYVVRDDVLVVIAVLHGARRDRLWQDRA